MKFSLPLVYDWYRNTLRNPKYRWWIILGTLLYLVSPIDVIPDFLPIAGQIDDVAILTLLVAEVSQLLIAQVQNRRGDTASPFTSAQGEPSTAEETTINVEAVSTK